jgi:hypothetical protein
MIHLNQAQIKDIAENLEMGQKCYVHITTNELVSFPDSLRNPDWEMDAWEEEVRKVEENGEAYREIEGMTSNESFRVMEEFAEVVGSRPLQERLLAALSRNKPFRNFKYEIDNAGEYRQRWFDFRSQKMLAWVKEKIDEINRTDGLNQASTE